MKLQIDATESAAYANALTAWMRHKRISLQEGLRDEARLLGQLLIQFTPPRNQAQGRAAVARDIRRALRPMENPQFRERKLQDLVRQLIRRRDYEGLEAVFKRFRLTPPVVVSRFSAIIHQAARNRRGQVRRAGHIVTPDVEETLAYIKTVQQRVGRAKGGWAAGVRAMGGRVAGWIARHSETGQVIDRTRAANPSVEFINRSEWSRQGDEDRIVANAIRRRTQALTTRLQHAIEHAARRTLPRR